MDVKASPCNNTSDPLCYEEGSDTLAVIIIPTLLALSTVVVVITILCSLFCRRRAAPERTSIPAHYTNRAGQECVSTSPVGPWEIPGECTLEGLEFWQTGHYGPICRGTMRRKDIPSAVVVKTLRGGINQPKAKEFVDWILFHGTVCKHQNLVRMLYCQTQRLPMYLVLEACSPGNLLHYLWTLRNASDSESLDPLQNFSERSAFLVAMQVAAGLDYLLSEHRLVHGNVAAKNVLIGPGFSVRVSGLGLAFEVRHRQTEKLANRRCQNDKLANQRTAEVPLKWQAPERIMNHPTTDRSDVWSFGIFLYELITLGSPPYPDLEPECVFLYLQKSNRMKRPDNCGGPLYDLMKYCWMWSFKDRPVFSAIIKLLGSYTYLAGTKYIYIPEGMDIIDYSKRAGVLP